MSDTSDTRPGSGAPARPGPPPNPVSAPFWDALAEGRLLLQRCGRCGGTQHYPRARCRQCWGDDLTWVEASGAGALWTWTVVHRAGHASWQPATPYVVAIVELDEGPRMLTTWTGPHDGLVPGLRVQVGAGRSGEHVVLAAHPAGVGSEGAVP